MVYHTLLLYRLHLPKEERFHRLYTFVIEARYLFFQSYTDCPEFYTSELAQK